MQKTSIKKMVVYSHDTFGLGNIRRMLAITEHLLNTIPDLSILLISGSPMIQSFRLPEHRFDYMKLPGIRRTLNGRYTTKNLETNFEELVALRSQIIQAAVSNFRPDVMIVDKKPRGIADELQPTLDLIHHTMPATDIVLLLRDILDEPQVTQQIWLKNHYFQTIERYYHSILVVGSRKVFDICQEYHFPKKIADKVIFCGYINRNHVADNVTTPVLFSPTSKANILITVGGGEDGLLPIKHYLNGLKQQIEDQNQSTLIVTGPEMSQQHKREILETVNSHALRQVQIVDFLPDLSAHMKAADLIVSMGGYNTIVEILAMNKKAIIIPRIYPVKEQLIRAVHLDKLNLIKCIHPDELTSDSLMSEVANQLAKSSNKSRAVEQINFNGLSAVTKTINSLLENSNKRSCSEHHLNTKYHQNKLGLGGICSVF